MAKCRAQCALLPSNANIRFHYQIEPNFEKAVAILEAVEDGKHIDDFLKLYKPMRRNLLRSFECSLNVRSAPHGACCMVRCGIVWCGMVWYVRHGVV